MTILLSWSCNTTEDTVAIYMAGNIPREGVGEVQGGSTLMVCVEQEG